MALRLAEVVAMEFAESVVISDALTPLPDAATLIDVAPPPETAIEPEYDCTSVGLNFT